MTTNQFFRGKTQDDALPHQAYPGGKESFYSVETPSRVLGKCFFYETRANSVSIS
jgi:hypothetical protein